VSSWRASYKDMPALSRYRQGSNRLRGGERSEIEKRMPLLSLVRDVSVDAVWEVLYLPMSTRANSELSGSSGLKRAILVAWFSSVITDSEVDVIFVYKQPKFCLEGFSSSNIKSFGASVRTSRCPAIAELTMSCQAASTVLLC
jgi:hypothetical protein